MGSLLTKIFFFIISDVEFNASLFVFSDILHIFAILTIFLNGSVRGILKIKFNNFNKGFLHRDSFKILEPFLVSLIVL